MCNQDNYQVINFKKSHGSVQVLYPVGESSTPATVNVRYKREHRYIDLRLLKLLSESKSLKTNKERAEYAWHLLFGIYEVVV